jgi:hypothetical protein
VGLRTLKLVIIFNYGVVLVVSRCSVFGIRVQRPISGAKGRIKGGGGGGKDKNA